MAAPSSSSLGAFSLQYCGRFSRPGSLPASVRIELLLRRRPHPRLDERE